ncbi:hypothetical protein AAE478_002921 [Parahypoxylon ruwenzoriense]
MCIYVKVTYRCQHTELLAGPNCTLVNTQFARIHSHSAWTDAGVQTLPFSLPDACLPRPENTQSVNSGNWCGWECRNSSPFAAMHAAIKAGKAGKNLKVYLGDGSGAYMGSEIEKTILGKRKRGDPFIPGAGRMYWDFDTTGTGISATTENEEQSGIARISSAQGPAKKVKVEETGNAGTSDDVPQKVKGLMGMDDATYGGPRSGVGWRENEMDTDSVEEIIWAMKFDWLKDSTTMVLGDGWLKDGEVFD